MELTPKEIKVQIEALEYIKTNKERLIQEFIINQNPVHLSHCLTIFMAGSPGAGKTEFSNQYLPTFDNLLRVGLVNMGYTVEPEQSTILRIDVDEIREFLPQYQKTDLKKGRQANAHIIQKAANKGLDILREYCLNNQISFLHDGTFSNFHTMNNIIRESLKKGRLVEILYLYLDPLLAWEFTKAREYLEGRNIIKENFVKQFFDSRESVDRIKKEFGDKIKVRCILKNSKGDIENIEHNVENVQELLGKYINSKVIRPYTNAADLLNLLN